jgi:hypothetical protein
MVYAAEPAVRTACGFSLSLLNFLAHQQQHALFLPASKEIKISVSEASFVRRYHQFQHKQPSHHYYSVSGKPTQDQLATYSHI